jgi:hypothetical protein
MASMSEEGRGRTARRSEARDKRERPRDHLGRPQPRGASNTLVLEYSDAPLLAENHRFGSEHLNAGRFLQAHEAWVAAWKKTRNTADAELLKGLSQLGAGYVHLLRGNAQGTVRLLRRAAHRAPRV